LKLGILEDEREERLEAERERRRKEKEKGSLNKRPSDAIEKSEDIKKKFKKA
jgi:hypothetical protein